MKRVFVQCFEWVAQRVGCIGMTVRVCCTFKNQMAASHRRQQHRALRLEEVLSTVKYIVYLTDVMKTTKDKMHSIPVWALMSFFNNTYVA